MTIATIEEILTDFKQGKMVILVDEEDRENEGDLLLAADFITPEAINFMARYGRGLICLTLTEERCRQLQLPMMVTDNHSPLGTNFTASIEAASGVTTGISTADRARTVQVAVQADAKPEDLVQPGHIFPLKAQKGGVLARAGHTEAGCDLGRLAGLTEAAVICEVLKENGEMARLPDLIQFASEHQLKIGTIADLIHYRRRTESLIERVAERPVRTTYGEFRLITYHDKITDVMHLALVKGAWKSGEEVLVRVHEPLTIIDLLEIDDSTHSWSMHDAMIAIAQAEKGAIVLLRRKNDADVLTERIMQTAPHSSDKPVSDLRHHGIGAQILKDLGISKMRLLATPRRMPSMTGFGLEVTGYLEPQN
ncbi:riboflavin biosynthesis protein RibBA [Nitrosomonas stercoris]|uniref:3,4-dihydroxy-2-butanone 4-phosphate synthase n=1 Tax=Nitrosomonas stercoris TaxID=1444684 RepID=A0A4Y1YR34_9PROT|nr:riboflavin biosynthesis protein RibBA [Nitrosomonas stercoris]